MSIKFPLSIAATATILTVFWNTIVMAAAYKSTSTQVVVTGLTAKQKYEIKTINAKGKQGKRKEIANTCGEVLIDGAAKYKSLVVGGQTINPATLGSKQHVRCSIKKTTTTKVPTQKKQPATADTSVIPELLPITVPNQSPMNK